MLSTKRLIILFSIFSIFILSTDFSEAAVNAEGYDFGDVELGSVETTMVSISNLSGSEVKLTMGFSSNSCSDFTIDTSMPAPVPVQPYESIDIKIGYSPSDLGECSAILYIFSGSPMPSNQITFIGIGVEPKPDEPEEISQLLLEKLQIIINYTNESHTYRTSSSYEQDNLSERQLKAFKKMLNVTYQLIENGYFEAAHNKLNEIYKKVDGKPESNDFVSTEKAEHLAFLLQDLIASFDVENKQAKQSKKAYN